MDTVHSNREASWMPMRTAWPPSLWRSSNAVRGCPLDKRSGFSSVVMDWDAIA
jgi:hypothetical protein